eukprot:TRINITY_DN26851_c0_g1_i1.p1 TRINITY_DN26851_c0_g1~~TRINITY_DN26851_c0_g1_i1.p1  ORF type:complete len:1033 (+),score=188.17 TRINITY_DN26851_c0_g1_i1:366-3464(+)
MAQMTGTAAEGLKRIFLELGPEDDRRHRAAELLRHSHALQMAQLLPLVMDRLVNYPSSHGLGIFVLEELFRLQPHILAHYLGPSAVYDLFMPGADDRPAAALLHALLCYKAAQGLSVGAECAKFQKLLMRRAKHHDLRRVPSSPLRVWLSKIWLDVPSAQPDKQVVCDCCARWVADPQASLVEKLPCLVLLRREFNVCGRPEGDAWLLGLLLEQVCRDPVGHSSDLQHLLWPLGCAPTPGVVKPLLDDLGQEQGRLVTLWSCLALWSPHAPPPDDGLPPWSPDAPPPMHGLLLSMFEVFAELPGAEELCRTCLLVCAMIAGSGDLNGHSAAASGAAADLLLLLHFDGPQLASEVWSVVGTALERVCQKNAGPSVGKLLTRLRAPPPTYEAPREFDGFSAFDRGVRGPFGAACGGMRGGATSALPYSETVSISVGKQAEHVNEPSAGYYGSAPLPSPPVQLSQSQREAHSSSNNPSVVYAHGAAAGQETMPSSSTSGAYHVAGPGTYHTADAGVNGMRSGPGGNFASGGDMPIHFHTVGAPFGVVHPCGAAETAGNGAYLPGFAGSPPHPGDPSGAMMGGSFGGCMNHVSQYGQVCGSCCGGCGDHGGGSGGGCVDVMASGHMGACGEFNVLAGPMNGHMNSMGPPVMTASAPQQPSYGGGFGGDPNGGAVVPCNAPVAPPVIDGCPLSFEGVRVGLQNTNNTCYMNTCIQALYLTSTFLWRIFSFALTLKANPSKVDKEDHELGEKLVVQLQSQMSKMAVTRHKHTDIIELLNCFPPMYRSGEQQDVTETVRFLFDKLGGYDQALIREVFAGELCEKFICQVCGNVRSNPETFSDIVLTVPTQEEVAKTQIVPAIQDLVNQRLNFEYLDDDNLLFCEACQTKQRTGKWCEIVSPPAHLCICLNRFSFNVQKMEFTKEKTPIQVDGSLQIGPFTYELYFVIIHTGKDASSGHYYGMGRRSEHFGGWNEWVTLDDSQIKPPDMSLLSGSPQDKMKDDNPYVLFYRCQQAPPTPPLYVPRHLIQLANQEDAKRDE